MLIVIVGCGRVGSAIAKRSLDAGHEVSVLDSDPLSHERLASLIGAHRPAVTTAMGELTRAGLVSRGADRMWVLHGNPPDEVRGRGLAAVDM